MTALTVSIEASEDGLILAPTGIATPYEAVCDLSVANGRIVQVLNEPDLGLSAVLVKPEAPEVSLRYGLTPAPRASRYPETAFMPRDTRHTRAARPLVEASQAIASQAGGGRAGIEALVAEAEARFDYGHPERRFTDGKDDVPHLSCGLTAGSCVDINTYLVASLRAAGYEAAYFYGYFFPKERGGVTDDGHCWVVTRYAGEVLEWDIAHHIKAALGPTRPALNPRPGDRVAVTHSMGHRYSGPAGALDLKILGEPLSLSRERRVAHVALTARLSADLIGRDAA